MYWDEDFKTPEEVRLQMMAVRHELGGHVEGLVDHSKQMLDWKHHVRAHPWFSLVTSLAAGYALVPKRSSEYEKDIEEIKSSLRSFIEEELPSGQSSKKDGLGSKIASAMGNLLFRAGIAYVSQQAGKVMGKQAANSNGNGAAP